MILRSELGALLRSERKLADLSLREMASAVHMSKSHLHAVEAGEKEISSELLAGILDFLGIELTLTVSRASDGRYDWSRPSHPSTSALVPNVPENGFQALWDPILIPPPW